MPSLPPPGQAISNSIVKRNRTDKTILFTIGKWVSGFHYLPFLPLHCRMRILPSSANLQNVFYALCGGTEGGRRSKTFTKHLPVIGGDSVIININTNQQVGVGLGSGTDNLRQAAAEAVPVTPSNTDRTERRGSVWQCVTGGKIV